MKTPIEKAFISFRILPLQWMPEERFKELLQWFQKYRGVTDELAFFTQDTHAPLPLQVIKKRAEFLAASVRLQQPLDKWGDLLVCSF